MHPGLVAGQAPAIEPLEKGRPVTPRDVRDRVEETESPAARAGIARRDLLQSFFAGALGLLAGCAGGCRGHEPAKKHRFRFGLDTYTVHRTLSAKDPELRRDLFWLIGELEGLGLGGLQIDPSHFPGDDPDVLRRLEEAVRPHRYYLEFGMGGWDVGRMAERIRLTAKFEGRALRTFCGSEKSTPEELRRFIEWSAPAFKEAATAADEHGVDIAVENHGDFTSRQLQELLDRVDHPRVGACLDTGNSLFRREDPLECARRLAPYTRSMHLKDWTMVHLPDGTPQWKEAVLGEGQIPLLDILREVAKHNDEIYVAVENPVVPSADEAETVKREQRHLAASAAALDGIVSRV